MTSLIINNGSTSFRFKVYYEDYCYCDCKIENIGTDKSYYKIKGSDDSCPYNIKREEKVETIKDAFVLMVALLEAYDVCFSKDYLDAIGIRIVSGANEFEESKVINEDEEKLKRLKAFMPLHYDAVMETYMLCKEYFNAEIVGIFDDAFHKTIPLENSTYLLPNEVREKYGIKKYGYHGISYASIVDKYTEEQEKDKKDMNSVICHLGGGSSICSVKEGQSFDTTMGFSPNSGLMMTSRSGDIDSSIIFYLHELGYSLDEIKHMLNKQSGYKGYLGYGEAERIVAAAQGGDKKAIELRKIIDADFKKNLLSMMALNNPNEIIITGGMGLKNIEQREMFLSGLERFGIVLDKDRNNALWGKDGIISSNKSEIPVMVMEDDEEGYMNKECQKVLKRGRM